MIFFMVRGVSIFLAYIYSSVQPSTISIVINTTKFFLLDLPIKKLLTIILFYIEELCIELLEPYIVLY